MLKKKTIGFFDLDHTIIRPMEGRRFPKDKDDWELCFDRELIRKGLLAVDYTVIVSNQGGISQGFLTDEEFGHKVLSVLRHLFPDELFSRCLTVGDWEHIINTIRGTNFIDVYWNRNYNSTQRKPDPFIAEYEIDMCPKYKTFMVGDMDSDRQFAQNARMDRFYLPEEYFNWENLK